MEQHGTKQVHVRQPRNNDLCRHQPYCPTVSHSSVNLCMYADQHRLSFGKTLLATPSANVSTSNCIRRSIHNWGRHSENHGKWVRIAEAAHEVAREIRDVHHA